MLLLVLDTALDATTVAVARDGAILARRCVPMERGHQERLAGLAAEVMAEAGVGFSELQRIGVGVGPGSFTGVRVGLAFAKGLALAWDAPLVGIGSLEALAVSAESSGVIAAAIDARRGRVYLQLFRDGAPLTPPDVVEIEAAAHLVEENGAAVVVGSGAPLLKPTGEPAPTAWPSPEALVRLAQAAVLPTEPPLPLYLRPPDAKTMAERSL